MVILIEGADATGKTTLAEELRDILTSKNELCNYARILDTFGPNETAEEAMQHMDDMLSYLLDNKNIGIFDRSSIVSGPIYQSALYHDTEDEDKNRIRINVETMRIMKLLNKFSRIGRFLYITCMHQEHVTFWNTHSPNIEYHQLVFDHLNELQNAYMHLMWKAQSNGIDCLTYMPGTYGCAPQNIKRFFELCIEPWLEKQGAIDEKAHRS